MSSAPFHSPNAAAAKANGKALLTKTLRTPTGQNLRGRLRTQKSRSVRGLPEQATEHTVQEEELCIFKVWDLSFLSKTCPLG